MPKMRDPSYENHLGLGAIANALICRHQAKLRKIYSLQRSPSEEGSDERCRQAHRVSGYQLSNDTYAKP